MEYEDPGVHMEVAAIDGGFDPLDRLDGQEEALTLSRTKSRLDTVLGFFPKLRISPNAAVT